MTDIWENRFNGSEEIRTGLVKEIHRQHAEIERLRAALKRIVDHGNGGLIGGGYAYGVAFAALNQQKAVEK